MEVFGSGEDRFITSGLTQRFLDAEVIRDRDCLFFVACRGFTCIVV